MRIVYKGHEIEVKREDCLGGYEMLYYSVFRESDGFECTSGGLDCDDTVTVQTIILAVTR